MERLERHCSILAGGVDAGNSVGFGDASRKGSKAGVISGGAYGKIFGHFRANSVRARYEQYVHVDSSFDPT